MRLRTVLVVLMIAMIAAFAAINSQAFLAPTTLSLLFTSFDAPLGLVMLGTLMLVVVAFALYMAVWQSTILSDSRRHAKELQQQRTLAEQAEASRFTELRASLHDEVERLTACLGQVQETLRTEIRENGNSLAASIAEMDDRLRRGGGPE